LKAKVVLELVAGTTPLAQLARRHRVSEALIVQWRKLFLERLPTLFGAELPGERTQARQVAELERVLGQKTLEIELLKKASQWLIGPSSSNGSVS
jgi:transposase